MSGEKPNESFNNAVLAPLTDSHRFGNDITSKIKGLSYNQLSNLGSIRHPPEGKYPHTIFIYDNESIKKVLDAFGNLIFALPEDQKNSLKTLKAVGGVGTPTSRKRRQKTSRTNGGVRKINSDSLSLKIIGSLMTNPKRRNLSRQQDLSIS